MDSDNRKPSADPARRPDIDELSAYRDRELDDERHREVQRHLVECAESTELLLDLAAFPNVPLRHGRAPLTAEQEDEDWRALERRILEDAAAGDGDAAGGPPAPTPPRFPLTGLLAATFALLSAGLGLLSFLLFERLDEARRSIRPPIVATDSRSLNPAAASTRRLDRDSAEAIAHGGSLSLYLVNPVFETPHPGENSTYRVTVSQLDTGDAWTVDPVRPDKAGGFIITLDRTRLPLGAYRLQLESITDGETATLATYFLRLNAPGSADPR